MGSSASIFESTPSQRSPALPSFEQAEERHRFDLPQLREPPPADRLPRAARVYVERFEIDGNTVFPTGELAPIVAPFEGREITNVELEEARRQLTLHYVNSGYINSGAVVPDQKVADGVIEIRIIEGKLSRIEIEGVERFKPEYFSSRLELKSGPPLNVNDIEEQLQILIQNAMIRGINAELEPGDRPGEAVLRAKVAESRPYSLAFVVDNKIPPSLGEARLLAQVGVNNLAGRGDAFSAELGLAEGINGNVKARYLLPVLPDDTRLGFYFERGDAEVVEAPFDALNIETELRAFGIDIYKPVKRTSTEQFGVGLLFERRKSKTSLLDEPFSFSPGVEEGESIVSVFRFFQDWSRRHRNQVFSAKSTISLGVDALDSTIHSNKPDSQFITWIPQFQWARRFGDWGHQISFRFDGQFSSNSLLPIEKLTVGGLDSVRGYRSNQLVRDQGYSASIQYQTPVFKERSGMKNLQFAAFLDTGGARNKSGPKPDPSNITGMGFGFIWNPDQRLHAEVYFAKGLDNVPEPGEHSLQDESLYFRLVARPF